MSTFEFDALRQDLVTQVLSCCNNLGLTVKLPNAPFTQPKNDAVWAEYSLMIGKTKRAELGSGERGLERTVAVFQIDLYVAENTGDGPITLAANAVKRFFNEQTFRLGAVGYYRFDVVSVKNLDGNMTKRGFYRLCCDAGVDFWHRNPDAPLTS